MGTPTYAKEILASIIKTNRYEVALVLTQPDRPVGRKKTLTPPPVKELALEHGIEVLQPQNLKSQEIVNTIQSLHPDFIVVAAFGQILPKSVLDIAPCINLHASLLPQYRGASPIQQSLLHNDSRSGVSAMLMNEGLDTGDILGLRYFQIPSTMGLEGLMGQLTRDAMFLTLDVLERFDTLVALKQIDTQATLCKKIKREDGEIDFEDAQMLYNQYRAYEGWPQIFTKEKLKLLEIDIIDTNSRNNEGEILKIDQEGIVVGCLKGKVLIRQLQPQSKQSMRAKAYCVGRGLKVGDTIV
ncbi:MAG: methionyl-tRNA formyltransferase [Campylobacterales bacterium]|nr:methionyl-tRNA formyltransferase [Campylobacterales bacterium]